MRPDAFDRTWWCRNINLPSIDYAFGPRLRVRLTLGGFTFPRKPAAFGERDSHPFYRYSFRHDHSHCLQGSLSVPLHRLVRRSPTEPTVNLKSQMPNHKQCSNTNYQNWLWELGSCLGFGVCDLRFTASSRCFGVMLSPVHYRRR